ncbi:MAG: AAA family ATPase [Myxococcales bacterium]|nr:AAA family ATPase [Myxococcales bacterium]|tara:strand:- start:142 stop:1149 length:1008 start_codon:yes stop_codon:yes gene_type:complete
MPKVTSAVEKQVESVAADIGRVRAEIQRFVVGQEDVVEGCLIALLAGGHVLLEGVPGLGKTELVKALGRVTHLSNTRIQFTPDMMPMDITGTHMLLEGDDGRRESQFQRGPIFANLVLADEINRATPKTQSALLEAMQEVSVTVGGETFQLERPFFVMATQNPIEMEGTYPLPEAQVDRFLFKLVVEFPDSEDLAAILDRTTGQKTVGLESVLSRERLIQLQDLSRQVEISPAIRSLVVQLILATHPEKQEASELVRKYVRHGSSPRGGQAVILAAKARALMQGRLHVAEQDVRDVLFPALRHRLLLNFEGEAEGVRTDDILRLISNEARLEAVL